MSEWREIAIPNHEDFERKFILPDCLFWNEATDDYRLREGYKVSTFSQIMRDYNNKWESWKVSCVVSEMLK